MRQSYYKSENSSGSSVDERLEGWETGLGKLGESVAAVRNKAGAALEGGGGAGGGRQTDI